MTKKYSEVRKTLKTGDLLAWEITRINSFFNFILFLYQKLFKVKYSHTGVVLKIADRVFVVEATPPVVRIFPLSLQDDFYYIPVDIDIKDNHIDELLMHIGKKYSLIDLIKGILKIRTSDNSYYCSELNGKFYKNCGLIAEDSDYITPQKLVETIQKVTNKEPEFIIIDKANLNTI